MTSQVKKFETTKFEKLKDNLRRAKDGLKAAQDRVLEAEIEIYKFLEPELPESGTKTFDDLKITKSFYEKWDQEKLVEIKQQFNEPWPFVGVWKPDGRSLSYLAMNKPDVYKLLEPALTLTPAKPSFTFKEEK